MTRAKDLTGQRFGRLTVLCRGERPQGIKSKNAYWTCRCDCGNTVTVSSATLKSGHTKSCGCLLLDIRTTHGMSKTPLYGRWNEMRDRCGNPKNSNYANYGARGISVCDQWKLSFQSFYEWAMSSGYAPELEIDRIDTNGDYCPENCRWVSRTINVRNRRVTLSATIEGVTKTLIEWAALSGVDYKTIYQRHVKFGWTGKRLLERPDSSDKEAGTKRGARNE